MIYLLAILTALIPAIPLVQVSNSQLAKAQSYWLLALLSAGVCWLAWTEMWLALIGFAFLCRWRSASREQDVIKILGSVIKWVALGATWFLMLQIPRPLWEWVVVGWTLVALQQVWLLVYRWHKIRVRMVGTLGSPVLTGLFLAAVFAIVHPFGWPLVGVGLFLTSSVAAGLAVSVSIIWLHPWTWPAFAGIGLVVTALWALSPFLKGRRIGEWTLRGDTLDSWWARWYAWRITVHEFRQDRRQWLFGYGPGTVTPMLRRWAGRTNIELPHETTCEVLHFVFEYGLVGGLAIGAFLWRVVPHLMVGDPWSAAWIGVVVMSFTHWVCRHPVLGLLFLAISARVVLG